MGLRDQGQNKIRNVLQGRGCKHLRAAAPDCKLEYPEPIRFYTGRSDCDQEEGLKGWQTTMKEHHPNPHGNGQVIYPLFIHVFDIYFLSSPSPGSSSTTST